MGDLGADYYSVDPSLDPDTAPTGAGGDPFSDSPPDTSSPETFDTGALPGGPDGQYSPFSPKGGFDFTDILRGPTRPQVRPAWYAGGGGSSRGYGYGIGSGRSPFGNLGVAPLLPGLGGGTGAWGGTRGDQLPECRPSSSRMAGMIVHRIRVSTGLRVSWRSLVNLIMRYGFDPVVAMTGAAQEELLFLFMAAKGVRHHHRGPGLYTISKKLRRADRLRATARRILGPALHAHARARHAFHRRRRGRK